MNCDRLLHAAARGARIEEYFASVDKWVDVDYLPLLHDITDEHRIHPDDLHLQYGPISTALREYVKTGKDPYTVTCSMAMTALLYECRPFCPFGILPEKEHLNMFALILSEAIADEGI